MHVMLDRLMFCLSKYMHMSASPDRHVMFSSTLSCSLTLNLNKLLFNPKKGVGLCSTVCCSAILPTSPPRPRHE